MSTRRLRYDNLAKCNTTTISSSPNSSGEIVPPTCTIKVDIPRNTSGNVFFYYGLVNFYQNARNYQKSRSYIQLRGETKRDTVLNECEPRQRERSIQIETESVRDEDGALLTPVSYGDNSNQPAIPCGLVAFSRFTDTFELCKDEDCTQLVDTTKENIAWRVDRTTRFLTSEENTAEENDLIRDEDFMVWMRLAAYRNWQKLYRRVLEDLNSGTYYVRISANFPVTVNNAGVNATVPIFYPVDSFNGQKFIFLSETTWFGGPNHILGIAYIVVGCVSIAFSLVYGLSAKFAHEPSLPQETDSKPDQPRTSYQPTVESSQS